MLEWIGPARSDTGEHPKVTFRFETETGTTRKVKLEINSHEHLRRRRHPLYALPEICQLAAALPCPRTSSTSSLATKVPALYQRRKGLDLFDLWWAHEQADTEPARIVALLGEFQAAAGRPMIRRSELRTNLTAKRVPSFLEEVRPLLRPGVAYNPAAALDWVEATFIPLLP